MVVLLLLFFIVYGVHVTPVVAAETESATGNKPLRAKFLPPDGQRLLILGQDLESVQGYVHSGRFPQPAGITTYFSIYHVRNPKKDYGGMGLDNDLKPNGKNAGWWDAGIYNAWTSAVDYPNAVLAIGMELAEEQAENGLARLLAGAFDPEIQKVAGFLKKVNKPVFLRIGYEFDGAWNGGYQHAARYAAAWRKIVDDLRAAGVTNTAYVWQSSTSPADDSIEGRFEPDLSIWYPGDSYVDWIGCSWFLRLDESGSHPKATKTQRDLLEQLFAFARAKGKPVLIAEAAPQGYFIEAKKNANIGAVIDGPSGENVVPKDAETIWREWYQPFFDYVGANADIVRGVAYINCYWDRQGMWGPPYTSGLWGDSRIEADPRITALWLKAIKQPVWLHGGPALFTALGYEGLHLK
ncbi:glycosyl hydrolase [Acanthopleuribacter pedis]|uniref:GH26 domain-containing protein n=1 Tax=Acanthopleuribacter pedis TaxID=442870 RepID=A0A8J7U7W8_9BACT|nr:glycosyl hydrolase [Acanthopleuribacter pedis]MBO1323444.1 hypothetical protein [Acanthopleuribacter pedis]